MVVNGTGVVAFSEAANTTSTLAGTLSGNGTLVQSGPGTLALAGTLGGLTGAVIISGGTLELTSAGAAGVTAINFALGTAGTLRIDGAAGPANTISGFANGGAIDLAGLRYAGSAAPIVDGNVVTVIEGTASETLAITGAATDALVLSDDGAGGTRLTNAAPSPVVGSGVTLTVSAGQTSHSIGVQPGGTLTVLAGGIASSTTLSGTELVSGTDSAALVDGGMQTLLSGGLAVGVLIGSYGNQTVSSGGTAVGGTVQIGGTQVVAAGGTASGTVVHGWATVMSGGVASATVINLSGGGYMSAVETLSGGQSISATVGSGGTLSVLGGTATGTAVSGGTLSVSAGGTAFGTILAGGSEKIFGGSATGTTVSSGAEQLLGTGSSRDTVVLSGGYQALFNGTVAVNDTVSSGGTVSSLGELAFTEAAGITDSFTGRLLGSGALVQSGPGTLALTGTLAAFTGTAVISGGTLELTSAGAAGSSTIAFASGTGGTLQIDGTTGPANTISGFSPGDVIDLASLGFTGTTAPTVSGNTVTVTEGSLTETLQIASAGYGLFRLYPDAMGGTDVAVPCYCPGTLILTDRGERPVETLAIGDRVVTLPGAAEPIRWVGRRSYAGRFLAGRAHLLPVRIRAGALGQGLPRRDLLVSPCHAMFIDGVLIPAGQLVNGTSVVQEPGCAAVHYVHVELAAHSVIFAEGAASETYLDDDNRGMFHNAAEFAALYGADAVPRRYYAPRLEHGFALEAVRRRLAGCVAA